MIDFLDTHTHTHTHTPSEPFLFSCEREVFGETFCSIGISVKISRAGFLKLEANHMTKLRWKWDYRGTEGAPGPEVFNDLAKWVGQYAIGSSKKKHLGQSVGGWRAQLVNQTCIDVKMSSQHIQSQPMKLTLKQVKISLNSCFLQVVDRCVLMCRQSFEYELRQNWDTSRAGRNKSGRRVIWSLIPISFPWIELKIKAALQAGCGCLVDQYGKMAMTTYPETCAKDILFPKGPHVSWLLPFLPRRVQFILSDCLEEKPFPKVFHNRQTFSFRLAFTVLSSCQTLRVSSLLERASETQQMFFKRWYTGDQNSLGKLINCSNLYKSFCLPTHVRFELHQDCPIFLS